MVLCSTLHVRMKSTDSADSDEEYVEEVDDEEFTPNEFDSLEKDEEVSYLNTKKRRGPSLKGKSSVKRQRRKRTAKTKRMNKRAVDGSGSDFRSESSDFEFTVSEEEQEQVREANQICRSLKTNLRRSRKTQKGKQKLDAKKNEEGKSVCSVCLTEEGKNTIRGTLNCCSHFFCFACIMEWSKVESRCPVCKQRFTAISKPAKCVKGFDDFDLRTAVIQVPERDQAYLPSEEELLQGFLNPYEDVICTECREGGDDALMLLCDICDSSAHTYCVGLGRDVPEGNWYCDGCRPASGSSHSQTRVFTRSTADASDGPSTYVNMAELDLNVTIPETPVSQGNEFLPSPGYAGGRFQASPNTGIGVSTVSRRRIRVYRILNMFSGRSSQAGVGDTSSRLPSFAGINSSFEPYSSHSQHIDRLRERSSHNVYNDGRTIQTQISNIEQSHPFTSRSSNEEHANLVRHQVHLLVRSQLSSLSQDTNLGYDAYADILRKSVDTIMASCGIELRRNDVYEAKLPLCLHLVRFGIVQSSSPISGCCLTCFENFVKLVVRRIIDIRLGPFWPHF